MIVPQSGKSGFLTFTQSGVPIPIYSWQFSNRKQRTTYRTSRTEGFPTGHSGVQGESLSIRGAGYQYASWFTDITTLPSVLFNLGWSNLLTGKRNTVAVQASLSELRFDFNYSSTNQPGFSWAANFVGVRTEKIITEEIGIPLDLVLCFSRPCTLKVTTTDPAYTGGILKHLKNASLIQTFERPSYRTARSNQRPVEVNGVKDVHVSLSIDGDFDYWFNDVTLDAFAWQYKFFYGAGAAEFFGNNLMKIDSVDNLNVNVYTGELVSATINLSAAYG